MVEIIIKSKIKTAVPDMSISSDVADELNKRVLEILEKASARAKLNGRRTLLGRDI